MCHAELHRSRPRSHARNSAARCSLSLSLARDVTVLDYSFTFTWDHPFLWAQILQDVLTCHEVDRATLGTTVTHFSNIWQVLGIIFLERKIRARYFGPESSISKEKHGLVKAYFQTKICVLFIMCARSYRNVKFSLWHVNDSAWLETAILHRVWIKFSLNSRSACFPIRSLSTASSRMTCSYPSLAPLFFLYGKGTVIYSLKSYKKKFATDPDFEELRIWSWIIRSIIKDMYPLKVGRIENVMSLIDLIREFYVWIHEKIEV